VHARTVDVLTTNLKIKIVCKGIPTRRSVAFLQCGQTVGWIKMPLDKDVSLPRRHCVRWGPSSPPRKGHSRPPPLDPSNHLATDRTDRQTDNGLIA